MNDDEYLVRSMAVEVINLVNRQDRTAEQLAQARAAMELALRALRGTAEAKA